MTTPNLPNFISDRAARKERKKRLKRLKRAYTASHTAWQIFNYYDVFFDSDIAEKLQIDFPQFEQWRKETVEKLSEICKIRQTRIHKLIYGEDINITI